MGQVGGVFVAAASVTNGFSRSSAKRKRRNETSGCATSMCRGLLLLDLEDSPRFHQALIILFLSMGLTGGSYVACLDHRRSHEFSVRALLTELVQDNMSLL